MKWFTVWQFELLWWLALLICVTGWLAAYSDIKQRRSYNLAWVCSMITAILVATRVM